MFLIINPVTSEIKILVLLSRDSLIMLSNNNPVSLRRVSTWVPPAPSKRSSPLTLLLTHTKILQMYLMWKVWCMVRKAENIQSSNRKASLSTVPLITHWILSTLSVLDSNHNRAWAKSSLLRISNFWRQVHLLNRILASKTVITKEWEQVQDQGKESSRKKN